MPFKGARVKGRGGEERKAEGEGERGITILSFWPLIITLLKLTVVVT